VHCRPAGDEGRWNSPKNLRASSRADGRIWFHTGDIARMDEDGPTSIVRKKDMIIIDGWRYPSEVESILYTHPR
jgi:long-chain acyl-CoA synthetase